MVFQGAQDSKYINKSFGEYPRLKLKGLEICIFALISILILFIIKK